MLIVALLPELAPPVDVAEIDRAKTDGRYLAYIWPEVACRLIAVRHPEESRERWAVVPISPNADRLDLDMRELALKRAWDGAKREFPQLAASLLPPQVTLTLWRGGIFDHQGCPWPELPDPT